MRSVVAVVGAVVCLAVAGVRAAPPDGYPMVIRVHDLSGQMAGQLSLPWDDVAGGYAGQIAAGQVRLASEPDVGWGVERWDGAAWGSYGSYAPWTGTIGMSWPVGSGQQWAVDSIDMGDEWYTPRIVVQVLCGYCTGALLEYSLLGAAWFMSEIRKALRGLF